MGCLVDQSPFQARTLAVCSIVVFFFSQLARGEDAKLSLSLKDEILSTEDQVTVGQLVDCSGSEEKCAEISGLAFEGKLIPNQTIEVFRNDIVNSIRNILPHQPLEILGDRKRVRVKTSGYRLTTAFVRDVLKQKIEKKIDETSKLRFTEFSMSGFMPKYFFTDELEIEIDNQILNKPKLNFDDVLALKEVKTTKLIVRSSGETTSTLDIQSVYLRLGFETERAVVTRYVLPGEAIQFSDVSISWVPISKAMTGTIVDGKSLIGRAALKGLSPYRPIHGSALKSDNLVSKGDVLRLHTEVGGLIVEKNIVAKQAGSRGDVIIVFDVETKKSLRAQIVDKETVRVL